MGSAPFAPVPHLDPLLLNVSILINIKLISWMDTIVCIVIVGYFSNTDQSVPCFHLSPWIFKARIQDETISFTLLLQLLDLDNDK